MSSPTTSTQESPRSIVGYLQWVGLCVVGLTALTLLAAHAPGRIRLLVLFAIVLGALCGWGMSRAAEWLGIAPKSIVATGLAGVLLAAAQVGLTLESWRLYVEDRRKEYFEDTKKGLLKPLHEQVVEKLRPIFERETTFAAYLEHRVKNLGEWESPWPAVFWAVEILLGTAAGIVVFRRAAGRGTTAQTEL